MRTIDVFYLVALWFLVLSFVDKKSRWFAAFLFLSSALNILIVDASDLLSSLSYVEKKGFLISFDGVMATVLTSIAIKESKANQQAIILALMVFCHSMVSLHLITGSYYMWAMSKPFYHLYNELITMLAILQMAVTRHGMAKGINNSLRSLQVVLFRVVFYSNRFFKSLYSKKERKAKA